MKFIALISILLATLSGIPAADPQDNLPTPRIVGGRNAVNGQFPYQVSLRTYNQHICGGSIISANYILTAAHCVSGNVAERMSIRAGSIRANSGGSVVGVAEIKVHPRYAGFDYDIALLRLSSPLSFNNLIRTIPLESGQVPSGARVTISGWGGLSTDGPAPNILQYTTLTALNTAECTRRIGNRPEAIMCLDHKANFGACRGDSGGPAVYKGKLVGVANFVINGCGSTFPDGYANVAFLNGWIKQNAGL